MQAVRYFKGLDVLRFLAATLVVLAHAHYHLLQLNIHWQGGIWVKQGYTAVLFFFTLSGFLLTCLGMEENTRHGHIDLKKFYLRRVLRIWPLYYLAVLLGLLFVFVLLPAFSPSTDVRFPMPVSLLCTLFFIPNYLTANGITNFGAINGLWSIGVEELFYLFFPLLLLLYRTIKNYFLIFFAALLIHLLLLYALLHTTGFIPLAIKRALSFYVFQYMLVGCLFAVAWMQCCNNPLRRRWFNLTALLLTGVAIALLVYRIKLFPFQESILWAMLFSIVIVFTAQIDNRWFSNNPLVYFGKISYGIYIFHPFVSYGLRFACGHYSWMRALIREMPSLYFLLLMGFTILVAHFSYRYYERRFLALKERSKAV